MTTNPTPSEAEALPVVGWTIPNFALYVSDAAKQLGQSPGCDVSLTPRDPAQAIIERLTRERNEAQAEVFAWIKENGPGGWINDLRVALKAQKVDVEAVMRLAANFATLYGRLHFERQCGMPIGKIGDEVEAAREALRAALEGRNAK